MTRLPTRCAALSAVLASVAVSGCAQRGAPSFEVVGAYFPAWMLCAFVGVVAAFGARLALVATGLAAILTLQFFVCASIGLIVAALTWLLWFGQ